MESLWAPKEQRLDPPSGRVSLNLYASARGVEVLKIAHFWGIRILRVENGSVRLLSWKNRTGPERTAGPKKKNKWQNPLRWVLFGKRKFQWWIL